MPFFEVVDVALMIDLGIFCAAALAAVFCLVGCFYVVPYRCCPDWVCSCCSWKAGMQEFNSMWLVRTSMLLTSASLMIAHMLPLSAIWSPNGVFPLSEVLNIDPATVVLICRMFLVLALGLAEPFLLLTVLFACRATNAKKTSAMRTNSSSHVLFLSALATIPNVLLQGIAAFFTVFEDQDMVQDDQFLHYLLSVSAVRTSTPVCRAAEVVMNEDLSARTLCIACLYPAVSAMISVVFIFIYLLSLWNIFDSMARAVLNRTLKNRLRWLQGFMTVMLILGVALRGVGIIAAPEDVGFSVIRLGYFLTVLVYVEAICWTLVWWPILDARRAEWRSEYAALETLQLDSSSPHQHSRASGSRILQANIPESSREGSGELRARGS